MATTMDLLVELIKTIRRSYAYDFMSAPMIQS